MIEFGKDHSPAWLELMSAYQIFRARLFDWSREPDQVKQRDLGKSGSQQKNAGGGSSTQRRDVG